MTNNFKITILLIIILLSSCNKKSLILKYPPNTIPLTKEKSIDKSYIESLHVLEFLYELEKDKAQIDVLKEILPKNKINKFDTLKVDYTHPKYRLYPFPMSINFAKEYCKWRSEVVTHLINYGEQKSTYSEMIEQNKNAKIIIKYSIPEIEDLLIADKEKLEFKKYDENLLKHYAIMTTASKDTDKLYFLRSIATYIKY